MTHVDLLTVDIALGYAEFEPWEEVECAVPVLAHVSTGQIVWQSVWPIPFTAEDWVERCMGQLSAIRHHMRVAWPEVEVMTDWWLREPDDEGHTFGLECK